MDKIYIGDILKPQGLKGEVKCKLGLDYDLIEGFTEVYVGDKQVPTRVVNKSFRLGYLYLTLSKIDDRSKADFYRNLPLYIDKKFYKAKQDVYLIDEIVGSTVVDQNNNTLGKLIRVENYGATDIFVIEQDKREYQVPFVKDIFIKVSANNKTIVANKENYLSARVTE